MKSFIALLTTVTLLVSPASATSKTSEKEATAPQTTNVYTEPVSNDKVMEYFWRYAPESAIRELPIEDKAQYVGLTYDEYVWFTKCVNAEGGNTMEDKVLVAATIWNRVNCTTWRGDTPSAIITAPGQFSTYLGNGNMMGNSSDLDSQLAIIIAYRALYSNTIDHRVTYFNCIGYNRTSAEQYEYVENYFMTNAHCNCDWCSQWDIPFDE